MAGIIPLLPAQETPGPGPDLPSPGFPPSTLRVPPARGVPSALPAVPPTIVTSIEVRSAGTETVDRNRVLSNMSLKVGSPFTQEKSDQDIKNLVSSGVAANVTIIPEASGDGVKLTVIVEARTNLGEILFLGNSALSSKTLEKEAELKTGVVVDEATLQAAQTRIREAYQKKGFPEVEIHHKQEKAADTGFTRVTFYITEGQKSLLHDIRFEGNTVFSEKELRKLVVVGDRDWWRVWDMTKRINSEKLERDITAVQDHYKNAGYMNAKVAAVDRVPVGDKVDVVFRISEGGKFDITGVGIEGMSAYPKTELEPSLQLTAGEPYSAGYIKSDLKLIHDYYGSRGYADVIVSPRITRTSPSQLNVVYDVTEGQRSYIRMINIKGNQVTQDQVIRRELVVVPGEEFNTTKLETSQQRLEGLGYFEPQGGVEFFPTDADAPGYKDINITAPGAIHRPGPIRCRLQFDRQPDRDPRSQPNQFRPLALAHDRRGTEGLGAHSIRRQATRLRHRLHRTLVPRSAPGRSAPNSITGTCSISRTITTRPCTAAPSV